ncbi:putative Acid phosphatase [Helianthus annuus]|nr:putative Acid phosphatase [Helianthus annuus]
MGKIGEEMDVDFILSTGDNFYDDGLIDVDDPLFDESFTQIYTATSLQKQWYSGKIHISCLTNLNKQNIVIFV